MATRNRREKTVIVTHEGGQAKRTNSIQALERVLYTAMLGEKTFYEGGKSIEKRLAELVSAVPAQVVEDMAAIARNKLNLRHAPLWVIAAMAQSDAHKGHVRSAIRRVINRADEPGELIAMWQDMVGDAAGIPNQLKKGLRDVMPKFDEYQLAKNDKKDAIVRIRDVMRLVHPVPANRAQSAVWRKLIAGELKQQGTWEDMLSAGKDKRDTFETLMAEGKLGGLAFLRNLRNMAQAGVDEDLISNYFKTPGIFKRVIPFRFLTAADHAPQFEAELEQAMFRTAALRDKRLDGTTAIMVDVSGSMWWRGQPRANTGLIKAAGMAAIAKELCDKSYVYTFSKGIKQVPTSRRGFGLIDWIFDNAGGGTHIGEAVEAVKAERKYDRIIVITDEQSADVLRSPDIGQQGYFINVAPYKNGVGYGAWTHMDGFSEAVFDWIYAIENNVLWEREL